MPRRSTFACLFALALALAVVAPAVTAQNIRIAESVDELEARAARDSTDAAAWYNLAVGYLSRNRYDRADTALQRSLALDQQFAPAWLARAVVQDRNDGYWSALRRRGAGDSAEIRERRQRVRYERRAYLVDPFVDLRILGSVVRFEDYGEAVEYYLGRDFRRFDDGIKHGVRGLVEGNYPQAYEGFEMAMAVWHGMASRRDTMPEFLVWYHGLAAARANHLPEAIADFENLMGRNIAEERKDTTRFSPLRTNEYRYMLAALLQRSGQGRRATELYREVATNDLGNYMAHVQLARLSEATGNWDDAIAERRAALNVNPDDPTLHLDLGVTLARATRWAQAESVLVDARELAPRDARVHYRLGVVQQQLGKREEARTSLEQFVTLAPSRFAAAVADARQRLTTLSR